MSGPRSAPAWRGAERYLAWKAAAKAFFMIKELSQEIDESGPHTPEGQKAVWAALVLCVSDAGAEYEQLVQHLGQVTDTP